MIARALVQAGMGIVTHGDGVCADGGRRLPLLCAPEKAAFFGGSVRAIRLYEPKCGDQPMPAPSDTLNALPSKIPTATSKPDEREMANGALVSLAPAVHAQLTPVPIHPAFSAPLDTVALLRALRRRWLPALLIGLIAGGAVSIAMGQLMPPPLHNVRSVLQISAVAPKVLFLTENQNPIEQYQRTQMAVVKSRLVIRAALQQPEVANLSAVKAKADPVLWLEKAIKADFTLGPEILSISLSGDDPEVLIAVVNAVAKSYTDVIVGKDHAKRRVSLQELKDVQKNYAQKVNAKQKELAALAVAAGSRDVQNLFLKQRIVLDEIIQAKKQLTAAQSEVKILTVKTQALQIERSNTFSFCVAAFCVDPKPGLPAGSVLAGLLHNGQLNLGRSEQKAGPNDSPSQETPVSAVQIEAALKNDIEVQGYKKKVEDAQQQIARLDEQALDPPAQDQLMSRKLELQKLLGDGFGPDYPKIKSLKEQIKLISDVHDLRYKRALTVLEKAEKDYAKICEEARRRIAQEIRSGVVIAPGDSKLTGPNPQLATIHDLKSWQALEKVWLDDVDRLTKESEFINLHAVKLEVMSREITNEEDIMRKIGGEIDMLEVEQRAPARVTPLEQAVLYPGERGPKQLIMMGGPGAGTFGLVLFLFAWLEYRHRRVGSSDDVVHSLGIRLVGTVPDYSYRTSRRLFSSAAVAQARFENTLTSSVDATRTMILHAAGKQGLKVVLITSAVGGEGKTSLASHLGASLARAGRKTLLVDADLRKPTLHRLFNVRRTTGFSELLQGQCSIEEVTRPAGHTCLSLITAGQTNVEAIQALAHEGITPIFQQLREQYDFIILDCSPILPVPDSLALTQHADAAILAVLRDVSRLPAVYAAYQRLSLLGLTILGAVVNGTKDEVYSSYYLQPVTAEG
jgi:capsular exopolysaccharide synthesis family protein